MKHLIPASLRRHLVNIDLIGCGGTGSQLLTELARLHVALTGTGHPGLHVTVFDPDRVTEASLGRTLFARADVGLFKSPVLVTRLNVFHGLEWETFPIEYDYGCRVGLPPDILITAVDRLRTRADVYLQMHMAPFPPPRYWMDLGNGEDTGQVVLGEVEWLGDPDAFQRRKQPRLRNLVDLYPDMIDRAEQEEPDPPSCSLGDALNRQALFINRHMATWGAELLWTLFRDGGLDYHGVFVDAATGRVNPLPVPAPGGTVREVAPASLPDETRRRVRRLRNREEVRR